MPLIRVKVIENVFTAEQKRQIVRSLTDALRLVADGMSNQQIADVLVLSPHTVHRHLATS